MVKGTLIETAEETSNSPIAIDRGLLSGFARETIFRNEDEPSLEPVFGGKNLESSDRFGLGIGVLEGASDCVELNLRVDQPWRVTEHTVGALKATFRALNAPNEDAW